MWYGEWWEGEFKSMTVIDRGLQRPVGFIWFNKPKPKEIKKRDKRKSKRK